MKIDSNWLENELHTDKASRRKKLFARRLIVVAVGALLIGGVVIAAGGHKQVSDIKSPIDATDVVSPSPITTTPTPTTRSTAAAQVSPISTQPALSSHLSSTDKVSVSNLMVALNNLESDLIQGNSARFVNDEKTINDDTSATTNIDTPLDATKYNQSLSKQFVTWQDDSSRATSQLMQVAQDTDNYNNAIAAENIYSSNIAYYQTQAQEAQSAESTDMTAAKASVQEAAAADASL